MHDNINMFVMEMIIHMNKLEGIKTLWFSQKEKK
jgi:hypothetical protein